MNLGNTSVLLIIEGTYPWYRGGVSEWTYQYLKAMKLYDFHILQVATDEFQQLDPENALYPLTQNVKSFTRVPPPIFRDQSHDREESRLLAHQQSAKDAPPMSPA